MDASMRPGLLILNKPTGMTSREAVDLVERLTRPLRAGHAGTLDPLATGVLVVCIGAATRLIEYVQRMPKAYTGAFLLGRHSPTEDVEGEVTELESPAVPTREQLVAAARALVGQIEQRPPAYSALKIGGRRAYELARQGKDVELRPRPVTVYALEVLEYEYPKLVLRIECSGGTYVRSLGRDLAESLGTAAVMSALVRTAIGAFRVEQAVDPRQLTKEDWIGQLLPMARAVDALPQIELSAAEMVRIRNGLTIDARTASPAADEIAALDAEGQLVAILRPRGPGLLGPARNLAAAQ
jgi:tRNA pseudouridine55 synthase